MSMTPFALQPGLKPRGDRGVEPVAVGKEGVVAPLLACRHVPPVRRAQLLPIHLLCTEGDKGIATG